MKRLVSISLSLLLAIAAFGQENPPKQWGGVCIEYNQYTPDHPVNGCFAFAKLAPEKLNPFGAKYPTYWFNAVRFYSAAPISQLWTAPREFRMVTAPQTGIAQKVGKFAGISWYAIFTAGPALAATDAGTQVGLSMATGGIGQASIGKGFTLGPVITWAPSVSALQALKNNQWSLGLVLGWGQ
jgi:hypothetical protein